MPPQLLTTSQQVESVFSAPPLLSTHGFSWAGLHVDCRWEPPAEIDEVATPWHAIVLFTQLDNPTVAERHIGGRFKVEQVYTGDMLLVPALVGHASRWNAAGEFLTLIFDPARMVCHLDGPGADQRGELIPHFATQDLLVLQLGLTLKRMLRHNPADRLYGETMATALAVHLMQHYSTRPAQVKTYNDGLSRTGLQTVIDYIHAHLDQDLSLETLAGLLQISPHYFAQLFKQSMGMPPHQYVIRCRVGRAKALLTTTPHSIAEIAYQSGFANQSHLNRHFKRMTGLTPGQFRQR